MTGERTPLIIPSETQIREFDGKLLLACVAAERGFPVIVGSRIAIHNAIHRLPRGIYLAKDVKQASRRMIRIITGLGNRVVSLDEEGAVVASPQHYWETRIDRETFERVSAQLAWGEEEAETLSRYPHHHGAPIHVTGNPRTDLMRRELRGFFDGEVASIQRRFGRPILINTNFGVINPYFPSLLKYSSAARSAKNPNPHFTMSDLVRHRHEIFEHFKKLVPDLADAFPETQIVVRPHPGENHDVWRECAARNHNAHVVFEGSVTPWLFACSALIHNGCTTAVEAAVQEAPAICWQPVVSEELEIELPNALSRCVSSLHELCQALRPLVAGDADPSEVLALADPAKRALLERHIAALDGPLAAERVTDALERTEAELGRPEPPRLASALRLRLQAQLRAAEKRLISLVPGSKHDTRYARHRFPGLEVPEVEERIARFAQALGRFQGVRARGVARDIFEIRG